MGLVRYNNRDFVPTTFSSVLDKFFSDFNKDYTPSDFTPRVDVIENEKSFEIQVALPGVSKEDLKLDVNDGTLTISGERKFEDKKEGRNYRKVETHFGSFTRSFRLSDEVDQENISANHKDGILAVEIPKLEKVETRKKIEIK
ncbi:MAG: Hsp20/alpha crystallin family protein [Bacteroidota bacterium]